ncbi:putative 3'-5' exonuclease related to the exonuclease domain of PolB [uncultured archaeon]|nr:putative 3'-5' exonuclease related to the exonuclease domain of PolB [uncultured archaeon]
MNFWKPGPRRLRLRLRPGINMVDIIVDIETTGVDPLKDQVVAIGMIGEWGGMRIFQGTNEKQILQEFWKELRKGHEQVTIVGFNIDDFDWQFLKLRSLKHRVEIQHFQKYVQRKDIRLILDANRLKKGTRLSDYCAFLGIPDGDELVGSMIPQLFAEGKYEEIKKHLEFDLDKTLQIWKLMKEYRVVE